MKFSRQIPYGRLQREIRDKEARGDNCELADGGQRSFSSIEVPAHEDHAGPLSSPHAAAKPIPEFAPVTTMIFSAVFIDLLSACHRMRENASQFP